MDPKKDKVFVVIIGILALAFVAGLAMSVVKIVNYSSQKTAIEKTDNAVKKLADRKKNFALTEENVETEKANQKKIAAAEKRKIEEIAGPGASLFAPKTNGDPGEFSSSLRGGVDALVKKFSDEKIALGDQATGFGFSRYLQNSQTSRATVEALPILSSEQSVIRFLSEKLIEARAKSEATLRANSLLAPDKRVPLLLKIVRREAAEFADKAGTPGAAPTRDELAVLAGPNSDETGIYRIATSVSAVGGVFPSLRRKDAVAATAFQIGFVAPTSVMREFILNFSTQGHFPIYVRDISVMPAAEADVATARFSTPTETPEGAAPADAAAAGAFDIFGEVAPGGDGDVSAPAVPDKISIRPESLSEFLVTLEHVVPIEKKSAPAESEEE